MMSSKSYPSDVLDDGFLRKPNFPFYSEGLQAGKTSSYLDESPRTHPNRALGVSTLLRGCDLVSFSLLSGDDRRTWLEPS